MPELLSYVPREKRLEMLYSSSPQSREYLFKYHAFMKYGLEIPLRMNDKVKIYYPILVKNEIFKIG